VRVSLTGPRDLDVIDACPACRQIVKPAAARLDLPRRRIATRGSGRYLFADYGAGGVRQISRLAPDGTLTTAADEPPSPGYSANGGPATTAPLTRPQRVTSIHDQPDFMVDATPPAITCTRFAHAKLAPEPRSRSR
jgi:hypothetical protein